MNLQLIIVILIIAAAVGYVARSIYRSVKGHACDGADCKCSSKSFKKV